MEPVESVSRWHQWSVKGTAEELTRFLDHLNAHLPVGWKRLAEDELQPYQPLVRPDSVWYSLAPTATAVGVTLSVDRVRETELRGGRIWFTGFREPEPTPEIRATWNQIMHFLDQGIAPAVQSVGASLRLPTLDDLFLGDLPSDIAETLKTFSHSARKVLPLDRAEIDRWQSFVIGAFQARAVVDSQRFVDWLLRQGWQRDVAMELSWRFFDQCQLLARYKEEVSAA